jgi:hypothetical protein
MALSPPCPHTETPVIEMIFSAHLTDRTGSGCHPAGEFDLPCNRPRGCRVFLKAAGRNGRT